MSKSGATSYKQTKFGILPRDEVIKLEVKGTKRGLEILQQIAEDGNVTLSPDFVKDIHKDCFNEILQNRAGVFRTIQVTYSSKEAPHFSRIPELIQNLCDDVKYALDRFPEEENDEYIDKLVQLLAQFQHRFVAIHPFVDYNGRMARLLTNFILMGLNLPIIEIQVENDVDRKEYIKALQRADEGDYVEIENIVAESLTEALQKTT